MVPGSKVVGEGVEGFMKVTLFYVIQRRIIIMTKLRDK